MADYWDGGRDNCYMKCSLRRIEYFKCTNGVGHEFLVFYFKHWVDGSSAEAVVSVDRTVRQQDNSSKQSSGLISPSSSENDAAFDCVSMLGSPRDAAPYLISSHGPYKKCCTLQFSSSSAPSALHVSIVLSLVHRQAPLYHLYESQCFWFADTAWRSLKALFPGNEELCQDHDSRSRYHGIALGPSDESVKAVCDAYQPEWQRTLEVLKQVKHRHEAEQAQVGYPQQIWYFFY